MISSLSESLNFNTGVRVKHLLRVIILDDGTDWLNCFFIFIWGMLIEEMQWLGIPWVTIRGSEIYANLQNIRVHSIQKWITSRLESYFIPNISSVKQIANVVMVKLESYNSWKPLDIHWVFIILFFLK